MEKEKIANPSAMEQMPCGGCKFDSDVDIGLKATKLSIAPLMENIHLFMCE